MNKQLKQKFSTLKDRLITRLNVTPIQIKARYQFFYDGKFLFNVNYFATCDGDTFIRRTVQKVYHQPPTGDDFVELEELCYQEFS